MGIPTLISTATASNATDVSITSGIDSTYDEYMFVCTDINPASDGVIFQFQCNAAGASGYNETITSTFFYALHAEDDSAASLGYHTTHDQAQGTGYQSLAFDVGNAADESAAGILHLFSPSNTTYVKHFYSTFDSNQNLDYQYGPAMAAGYINTTTAIDDIQFKMSSGNFDGVIQLFGIS